MKELILERVITVTGLQKPIFCEKLLQETSLKIQPK